MTMNFGAGPSKIPVDVVAEIKQNLDSYEAGNSPIGVMEISHRGQTYAKINNNALNSVRSILSLPDNYKVLFAHGGSAGVFSSVCLNLMGRTGVADYIVTGLWSSLAAQEASKYGKVNLVLPKVDEYVTIPDQREWKFDPNASFVYYCDNETANGLAFDSIPETNGIPLVCDMCSSIFTKPIDITKFGMIFASSQKNIGTAGAALIIIREDLIGHAMPLTPTIMNYKIIIDTNSILNTPPVFTIYVMSLVLERLQKLGGLQEMQANIKVKSEIIYNEINASNGFYVCKIDPKYQSKLNVAFSIAGPNSKMLVESFLKGAEANEMYQLNGHKAVGGIRVSLHNSITVDDAKILAQYMKDFHQNNSD